MKRWYFVLMLLLLCSRSYAEEGLMQVFQEALMNDPIYQKAVADTLASREDIGKALAELLPKASLAMTPTRDKGIASGSVSAGFLPPNNITRTFEIRLKIKQVLFDYAKIADVSSSRVTAKEAVANLNAALQDLMLRTAQAYFNVVQDEEMIQSCIANKNALEKQYQQVRYGFKAGSKTKTDVYSADAARGTAENKLIDAESQLATDKAFLRTITNRDYENLAKLGYHFPIVTPQPERVDVWIAHANQQNWKVKANEYAVKNAIEQLKHEFSGHLPNIEMEAYYNVKGQHSQNGGSLVSAGFSKTRDTVFTLNLNVPIFSGGGVVASTNQATYHLQAVHQQLESAIRNTTYATRQHYINIVSGKRKIHNDQINILSAESSLRGVNERYKSGAGTLLDVLNQREKLHQAKEQYTSDRYAYVMSLLNLKNAVGTLNAADLAAVDAWLKR